MNGKKPIRIGDIITREKLEKGLFDGILASTGIDPDVQDNSAREFRKTIDEKTINRLETVFKKIA